MTTGQMRRCNSCNVFCGFSRLFERGLSYVGTDYLSAPLWDKYIEFEYSQQQWSRLADIYTRILQNPIQQLDRYYNSFRELASSRPLAELRTEEETAALAAGSAVPVPGNEATSETVSAPKAEVSGVTEVDDLEKYLAIREEMYKKSKEFDAKIHEFETAIRRPYFHVKPLDEIQLGNWHRYLDFTEKLNDFSRTVKLYERCLIACANYQEYWIRYVECMAANGSMEHANNALIRATQIFVKRQPDIHLFAARFHELMGDIAAARAEYQLITTELAPGLLDAIMRYANFEHRQGNSEAAFSIFETAIATEKAKEQSQSLPFLYILYCRFLQLVVRNSVKATEVLTEALELLPCSRPLIELAIHLATISLDPGRIEYLDSIIDKILLPKSDGSYGLSVVDREELSSIFLEFLDIFGDVQAIKKAESRHRLHFLPHKIPSESRKRHAEDSLSSDKSKVSKNSTGMASAVSPAQASYQNGQAQWGAGYAQQQQTWQQPPPQQTPQVQPQQWMPGYSQQGGYAPYGGYTNYAPPQQPASTGQQGYAAYGQGYQAQPFPQQSYAQPAPTYTAPQQQAATPQYYTGYY
eukprot:TRINITY_DN103_c0_g1_i5.p1 TRINITY_DN103_c0_g1~~TRINITY_DN103_c0_g1_i5.p1  ORF type:complete len:582 (+),score=146.49 TRINITY_DN103_c0_g1_i5:415-2160(+)